eukprot:COSAG03_NODE_15875_length_417_cov_28.996855_1_plen_46_part_10
MNILNRHKEVFSSARMLINADSKRRSARNSVRASRPQSTSSVAVHG